MKTPIRVAVTGAAGNIGYALLFRIANGDLFSDIFGGMGGFGRRQQRGADVEVVLELIEDEAA